MHRETGLYHKTFKRKWWIYFVEKYINLVNKSIVLYSVPQELSVCVALDEILIKVLHKILMKILRDP